MTWFSGHLQPTWCDEHTKIKYYHRDHQKDGIFTDWAQKGYNVNKCNGLIYEMYENLPIWSNAYINLLKWKNVSVNLYLLQTENILPLHSDHYVTYQKLHNITDTSKIWRAVVFMEDWKTGHYFQIENTLLPTWKAGDFVAWQYDTPHMAANIGIEPRYTMQITGIA